MLIGVDGGGFTRSTSGDFNLLKTLSKYLSSPTKTIQLSSVDEMLHMVAGTQTQGERRGVQIAFA